MKRAAVQYVLRQGANIVAAIVEVLQSKLAHPSFLHLQSIITNVELAKSLSKNTNGVDKRTRIQDDWLVRSNKECGFIASTTMLTHQIHIFVF